MKNVWSGMLKRIGVGVVWSSKVGYIYIYMRSPSGIEGHVVWQKLF